MKILSWNINGIRASKVDLKTLFDSLDADVICLQETKVTRDQLDEPSAIVDGYNSYFSFSRKRSGYSGTAIFCKDNVVPVCAEEGLSGLLKCKDGGNVGCYGSHFYFTDDELVSLDSEGRAVITQHKIRKTNGEVKDLAVINVYCPRADPEREDRHLYKQRFFALLQTRAEALVKNGSHVIVLGDINTTHKKIDHVDPNHEEFVKRPSRIWLNQFLCEEDRDPSLAAVDNPEECQFVTPETVGGMFVDTYRYFYPDKESAYTNWCTVTGARATNYGRRLDYILGDIDLVKSSLKDAGIMALVEGSDHCPVTVELKCTVESAPKCPPFCTKYMPEFVGKQQKLSQFFTKLKQNDSRPNKTEETENSSQSSLKVGQKSLDPSKTDSMFGNLSGKRPLDKNNIGSQMSKKQKLNLKTTKSCEKQASLTSFFSRKSKTNTSASETYLSQETGLSSTDGKERVKVQDIKCIPEPAVSLEIPKQNSDAGKNGPSEIESKYFSPSKALPKLQVTQESSSGKEKPKSATAWKSLLKGPAPPPLCKGHKEPCVLRTVKKDGPNKGKQFYVCAKPEGLKSNPESRCDYFVWKT